ncbi:uncharacterized protein LOC9655582 [Selaginella moellendorffii]|uniref:uncharacterized protein LOC9655582 n=1 Tax=Selaginella moellendorffii TaxID=88036 RepID=UPI000D1CB352|nr:uncharacterized protein LOC9655582 [Selaginella moellendorffii]|eukprot:XP_024524497.1 uncharacterized protein LOC9655582 [Selaginella moellendorffii]
MSICLQVSSGGIRHSRRDSWEKSGFSRHKLALARRPATTSSDSSKSSSEQQQEEAKGVPEWAKPGSDVPPPWASGEKKQVSSEGFQDLPYIVYLVGSIFEYFNKNPVFGVIQPDSPFYTPAFLWFRAIKLANKDAERQDKEDGYF